MKTEFRSAPHERVDLCCDYYRLTDYQSFDEVLAFYEQQRAAEPDHQWLLTLDDLAQADYTSCHACLSHDLDDVRTLSTALDLSHLPATRFEDGKHVGYVTLPAEMIIRQTNFQQRLAETSFEQVIERNIGFTTDYEVDFLRANQQPLSVIDDVILLIKVPVSEPLEALLGLPNGYFSSDLSPMESYRLAERLQRDFGYRLLGVGASYLGFYQTRALTGADVTQLLMLMQQVYRDITPEQLQQVEQVVTHQPLLLLSYTE
ncbi:hypothetical protein L9G74_04625 [Shewanella sp. C32]|uniref:Uncharacterized protein n=1 Tax=Shewanella electrica TaxID=515560 RepID=A0ABT2FHI2_9GAMM|nr:hypothetical protein [Shewanella electrica]MCH1923617.1 hypothetical protein [Shewanella electrica]MCS4555713.1 hypothetical protein [Shewanella electrica]